MAASALITGATGLIGTHVVQNWDVPGIDPVPVDRQVVDLLCHGTPTELVQRVRPFVVVHLAWTASGSRSYRTSPDQIKWVAASLELEQVCRAMGSWFIATGSVLDADGPSDDEYSAAKCRLRQSLEDHIAAREVTWLRPYYVVDPERRRPALVAEAIAARETGSTLELRTPESQHDFIHAFDVGQAIILTVRNRIRGVVSIGTGRLRRVRDVVEALGVTWVQKVGVSELVPHNSEAADSRQLRDLGWSPHRTDRFFGGA